mmetsp:Transcript_25381/g.63890  ORF Transcript_25381/g.63890 Transcript_25381/m.63890 type:complete len:213 (-) Transcript_25381:855-1493(-)
MIHKLFFHFFDFFASGSSSFSAPAPRFCVFFRSAPNAALNTSGSMSAGRLFRSCAVLGSAKYVPYEVGSSGLMALTGAGAFLLDFANSVTLASVIPSSGTSKVGAFGGGPAAAFSLASRAASLSFTLAARSCSCASRAESFGAPEFFLVALLLLDLVLFSLLSSSARRSSSRSSVSATSSFLESAFFAPPAGSDFITCILLFLRAFASSLSI